MSDTLGSGCVLAVNALPAHCVGKVCTCARSVHPLTTKPNCADKYEGFQAKNSSGLFCSWFWSPNSRPWLKSFKPVQTDKYTWHDCRSHGAHLQDALHLVHGDVRFCDGDAHGEGCPARCGAGVGAGVGVGVGPGGVVGKPLPAEAAVEVRWTAACCVEADRL